ncbi:14626_t:CDS:2 [Funneliformis geosporum]|uniref:1069_t:CDS:1 n=1 Tax=Funneliformis geosporum TaxID=1117311 RepID=A0A9W4SFM6_9GLOM|nr:14626_t:CDS:2 [Funneliformis geosporum]CAI2166664.1 1069_t:CDS:2 [Funneliformis geosporum]
MPNSRILAAVEPEKILTSDFSGLFFEGQSSSKYIIRILTEGIVINNKKYNYLGQSNSLLKDRKCILMEADEREIKRFLDKFGDWTKFNNTAKLAKRIGLLFSTGEKVLDLPFDINDNNVLIDDVTKDDFCFTDGCGLVSKEIIREISNKLKIKYRNKRYDPCVIQIRYRGFKGILLLGTELKGKTCRFRKSMKKFEYRADNTFYVVEHSKPYAFGRLNTQIIILLSSLGVPDEALLHKQEQHFERLNLMFTNISIAFEFLLTNGEVALADELFENGFTEKIINYLNQSYNKELNSSIKIKKVRSETVESEKLRIIVKDSRLAFGASDPTPTRKLKEYQCFFRPIINNKPTTIIGPIFYVRNPCYHPGDIVVLKGVHLPECEDIVDVLLFSVNGDVPAAHKTAGGDLDGDKFFVCWDSELMPRETAESYGYPGGKDVVNHNIKRADLIKHFAMFSNAGVSRCASLFTKWADAKGPKCLECLQINKLFSSAVDGQSVKIPSFLTQPPEVDDQIVQNRIWNKLTNVAEKKREESKTLKKNKDLSIKLKMGREELCTFLEEGCYEATDYELLCFLIRWCHVNDEDIKEFLYYLDFTTFTVDEKRAAIATGRVPIDQMLNAIHSSNIMDCKKMINYFSLGEGKNHWKLFHQDSEIQYSTSITPDISRAIASFRRVFIALKFDHELSVCISLYGEFEIEEENDADGKIDIYGFNRSGTIIKKKSCTGGYKLSFNENYLQIYHSHKRNTFVWLGSPKHLQTDIISLNDLDVKSSLSVAIDKLCHTTAKKTSKIQKKKLCMSEIYVVSNRDGIHTRYQVVNPEYRVNMEIPDVDEDYNPPDSTNVNDENDKRLLSLPLSANNVNELMERMECWIKYAKYDRVIKAYELYLGNNNSRSDLQNLVEFSSKIPIVYGSLIKMIQTHSLEVPSMTLVSLIGTCFKASKCKEDTVVLESVNNLLKCSVSISMIQLFEIINHLVLYYPCPRVLLEEYQEGEREGKNYLEDLFDIIKQKLEPPVNIPETAVTHFMHLVKILCIQTLEESYSENQKTPRNRYQARQNKAKAKNRVNLMSTGPSQIRLRPGDLIILKRLNKKSIEPISVIRAVVITMEPEASIEVSWVPRDILIATWKVKKVGNIIGFRQSMEAIERLYPTQMDEISPLLDRIIEPNKFDITIVTNATDTTDEGSSTTTSNQALNRSQQKAIEKGKNGILTLWQGPAGTGKTKSIYQLILNLLDLNPKLPILVTAATNAAVDNIALLLIKLEGIKTIRIGETKTPELFPITLEAGLDGSFKRINSKKGQELLKSAKIICATCVGSGTSLLEKIEFEFVIVDEASQVSEPNCLIPLSKKCERFLLVGDHKQLPPFCHPKAKEAGYSVSLFERMHTSSYPFNLLDTQYRMHPGISKFPNDEFYQGRLNDGINFVDRPLVEGFNWPNPKVPVSFVQVSGIDSPGRGGSRYNEMEVENIINTVKRIVENGGVQAKEIGIISLYNAQLEKITGKLGNNDIEVKTADGFQGKEKELILITCVRCNEKGSIGFLEDPRRFNVMLTRAKRGLIIFGDRKTLCTNEMWKRWFTWVDLNDIVVDYKQQIISSKLSTLSRHEKNMPKHTKSPVPYIFDCEPMSIAQFTKPKRTKKKKGSLLPYFKCEPEQKIYFLPHIKISPFLIKDESEEWVTSPIKDAPEKRSTYPIKDIKDEPKEQVFVPKQVVIEEMSGFPCFWQLQYKLLDDDIEPSKKNSNPSQPVTGVDPSSPLDITYEIHHFSRVFCKLCQTMFINYENYNKHVKDDHGVRIFVCDICKDVFYNGGVYMKHIKQHRELFECTICLRKFRRLNSLDAHQQQKHPREVTEYGPQAFRIVIQ